MTTTLKFRQVALRDERVLAKFAFDTNPIKKVPVALNRDELEYIKLIRDARAL